MLSLLSISCEINTKEHAKWARQVPFHLGYLTFRVKVGGQKTLNDCKYCAVTTQKHTSNAVDKIPAGRTGRVHGLIGFWPEENLFYVVQLLSCVWLCGSMDCSMPGFPVLHLPPGVCSNSCPLSRWCYPTISSSILQLIYNIGINLGVQQSDSVIFEILHKRFIYYLYWPK